MFVTLVSLFFKRVSENIVDMKARAFKIYAIAQKKNSFIDWYLLLIIIDNF